MHQFCRILDQEPGASLDQIKAARTELLEVWHQDRFEHQPKLAAKSLRKDKRINEAYEKLIDFFDSGGAYNNRNRVSNNPTLLARANHKPEAKTSYKEAAQRQCVDHFD